MARAVCDKDGVPKAEQSLPIVDDESGNFFFKADNGQQSRLSLATTKGLCDG